MIFTKKTAWLWFFIFVFFAVFAAVASLRHYNFQTQAWDMGIFTQIFWNAINGRAMTNTIEEIPNHFGVHFSPFLFILVPVFLVFPSPYYLLIIQTLALALGALPLYLCAEKILGRRDFALILASGYLLYPPLHWVNLFDFHPIAFLIPALFAAFYFFCEKKFAWFGIFMIAAASVQEDAVLAAMFAGLFLALTSRPKTKERKIGFASAVAAMIYFAISIKIIMPSFGGGLLRLDRYAELGGSFSEIARNLFVQPALFFKTAFTVPKLKYLFRIFLPAAFLPIVYLPSIALLVPGLAENLLTTFSSQFSGFYQYDSMLIAGMFISSAYGLNVLQKRFSVKDFWLKRIIIACFAAGFLFFSPVSPFYFPYELFLSNENRQTLREIVKNVPPNSSVAAQTNIVPHLAKRKHIYTLGAEPFMADMVIIDGADFFGFKTPRDLNDYADSYALSGKYDIQIVKNRFIIFTKK